MYVAVAYWTMKWLWCSSRTDHLVHTLLNFWFPRSASWVWKCVFSRIKLCMYIILHRIGLVLGQHVSEAGRSYWDLGLLLDFLISYIEPSVSLMGILRQCISRAWRSQIGLHRAQHLSLFTKRCAQKDKAYVSYHCSFSSETNRLIVCPLTQAGTEAITHRDSNMHLCIMFQ